MREIIWVELTKFLRQNLVAFISAVALFIIAHGTQIEKEYGTWGIAVVWIAQVVSAQIVRQGSSLLKLAFGGKQDANPSN